MKEGVVSCMSSVAFMSPSEEGGGGLGSELYCKVLKM